MSVSARIAEERCEALGKTIGYNIRMESQKSASTQVLVVTPGVLLRKLQSDKLLEEYSHVIIDEAHEQDRFTEFLLIILRDVCSKRSSLKLILMSATMHTNKLSSYFNCCPHISVGGSCFPVTEFYLENVLQFTDFLKKNNTKVIGNETLTDIYKKTYFCPNCNSSHSSAEELGTHVAFCTTIKPANNQLNQKQGKEKNSKMDLNNLVRKLETAAILSNERKNGETEQDQFKKLEAIIKGVKSNNLNVNDNVDDIIDDDDDDDDIVDNENLEDASELNGDDDGNDYKVPLSIETIRQKPADTDTAAVAALKQYHQFFDDDSIDYDLIYELLKYIFKSEFIGDGSVLVFLPGWDDISRMTKLLASSPEFGNSHYKIVNLHSGIPKADQNLVFQRMKKGEHKIILSTNIAETSITIEDVTVVINSGKQKEKEYDPYLKLTFLKSSWISKAASRQRRGRAGRVSSGVCFHLFSRQRHESLAEFQTSELLRMPLEELVLQCKQLGVAPGRGNDHDSVTGFLSKALNAPHQLSITNAIDLLKAINCLDDNENLTTIGQLLSKMPMDPRLGRMMLLGCMFGIGPSILLLSSSMNYRDPFIMPTNDHQKIEVSKIKQLLSHNNSSDQYALLKAIEGFDNNMKKNAGKAFQYCDQHYLSKSTMNYISNLSIQLQETMKEVNIIINSYYNKRNNNNATIISSIIGISLYPDISIREFDRKQFVTEKGRKSKIHPSSVNSKAVIYKQQCAVPIEAIGYQDLIALNTNDNSFTSAGLAMLNTTPLSIFGLLLICGSLEDISLSSTIDINDSYNDNNNTTTTITTNDDDIDKYIKIEIDQWLQMKIKKSVYNLTLTARKFLTAAMHEYIGDSEKFSSWKYASKIDSLMKVLVYEQPILKK